MNWYKKAQTDIPKRFRPKETYVFPKPLQGPSGASIISYEWQYTFEDYVDSTGEDRTRRISDWDKAVNSEDTNRLIVHQFIVSLPDGTSKYVSAESAAKLLGYISTSQIPPSHKNIISYVKQIAKLKLQIDQLTDLYKQFQSDYQKVLQLPLPPINRKIKIGEAPLRMVSVEWIMGDTHVWEAPEREVKDDYQIPKDSLELLTKEWRKKRMIQDLGWKNFYEANKSPSEIRAMEIKIKKLEDKIKIKSSV